MIATSPDARRRTSTLVRLPSRAGPAIGVSERAGGCRRSRLRARLRAEVSIEVIIRARAKLCGVAQRLDLALARQPAERLRLQTLDLPARDAELPSGLADRRRLVAVDAVAEAHH